jgi:hypothetical protein
MIIANPLYDVVFKSLMEDAEIAKEIISTLIGEEILELHPRPQESVITVQDDRSYGVTLCRLDFAAVARSPDGATRKILVEVQKSKIGSEVRRFREYLARHYKHPEVAFDSDGSKIESDPHIVAIYILGFNLAPGVPPYAKVDRKYIDAVSREAVDCRDDFIESLTHDMFVLQTRRIPHAAKCELERLLAVFSQSDFTDDTGHTIAFPDRLTQVKSKMFQRILRQLTRLGADRGVREKMEVEDRSYAEFEHILQKRVAEIKAGIADERRQKEEAMRREEEAMRREEEERRQKEEALRHGEEERRQKEEALARAAELERRIQELTGRAP